jgi:hypothetical protein
MLRARRTAWPWRGPSLAVRRRAGGRVWLPSSPTPPPAKLWPLRTLERHARLTLRQVTVVYRGWVSTGSLVVVGPRVVAVLVLVLVVVVLVVVVVVVVLVLVLVAQLVVPHSNRAVVGFV